MTHTEAIEVATKAMEDALSKGGGDDVLITKALNEAMQDRRVAEAFIKVGYKRAVSGDQDPATC